MFVCVCVCVCLSVFVSVCICDFLLYPGLEYTKCGEYESAVHVYLERLSDLHDSNITLTRYDILHLLLLVSRYLTSTLACSQVLHLLLLVSRYLTSTLACSQVSYIYSCL